MDRITIDFNKESFDSLERKLIEQGKNPYAYEIVMNWHQFDIFKHIYKLVQIKENEFGIIVTETTYPTPRGIIYGMSYVCE